MAASYHQLGMLAQDRGDYDAAEPLYRRSLEINERIGDQAGMATSYHQLGMLAQDRGDYDAAEPLYRRSLEINERIGDQAGMATSYHQLGILAQLRGDYDAAEPLYRRSLEINERIGDQAGMAASYHQLGMLAQLRGDYDAAEPLYRRSLEISERIGDQAGIATSYAVLGGLSEALGNLDEAVAYRVGALAIRLQIGTATAGDVQALAGLRRRLGRDRFRAAALASGLDEESAANLMEMLDQQEGRPPGTDPWPPAAARQLGPAIGPDGACTDDLARHGSGRTWTTGSCPSDCWGMIRLRQLRGHGCRPRRGAVGRSRRRSGSWCRAVLSPGRPDPDRRHAAPTRCRLHQPAEALDPYPAAGG